jgi:hypothetical protein
MFNRDFNKLHTYKLEGSIEIFVGCFFVIFYILIMGLFILQVKQADELENILAKKFLRFLSMRAEAFHSFEEKTSSGVIIYAAIITLIMIIYSVG